jgi:hypothetical protein
MVLNRIIHAKVIEGNDERGNYGEIFEYAAERLRGRRREGRRLEIRGWDRITGVALCGHQQSSSR